MAQLAGIVAIGQFHAILAQSGGLDSAGRGANDLASAVPSNRGRPGEAARRREQGTMAAAALKTCRASPSRSMAEESSLKHCLDRELENWVTELG